MDKLIPKLYTRLIGQMDSKSKDLALTEILNALRDRISAIEEVQRELGESKDRLPVTVALLTNQEWRDLVFGCVRLPPRSFNSFAFADEYHRSRRKTMSNSNIHSISLGLVFRLFYVHVLTSETAEISWTINGCNDGIDRYCS